MGMAFLIHQLHDPCIAFAGMIRQRIFRECRPYRFRCKYLLYRLAFDDRKKGPKALVSADEFTECFSECVNVQGPGQRPCVKYIICDIFFLKLAKYPKPALRPRHLIIWQSVRQWPDLLELLFDGQ